MSKQVIAGEVVVARDIEVAKRFASGERPDDSECYALLTDIRYRGNRTFQMYDRGGHRFGARIDAMDQHSMIVVASNARIGAKDVFLNFSKVVKVTHDGNGITYLYVDMFIEEPKMAEGGEHAQTETVAH